MSMKVPEAARAALIAAALFCGCVVTARTGAAQTLAAQTLAAQTVAAQSGAANGRDEFRHHLADGLSHSAAKALTYKAATTASNLIVLSVAAGGVAAGTALTLAGAAASVAVYAVNDMWWDSATVPPPREEGHDFDLQGEFWSTGRKFLTYKATTLWIKVAKFAAIYAISGSAVTSLAAVSATTAINAGLFFGNNFAWDYLDPRPAAPAFRPAIASAGHLPPS